jgi:hypothetical protein
MKPPTVDEVRAYAHEKGLLRVDPQEFVDYFEDGEPPWHDSTGKPVKNWKQKLRTWESFARRRGEPQHKCRICPGYGVYTSTDDAGQQYWLCEEHKPQHRKVLPDELTDVCGVPKDDLNMGTRRTALIRQLRKA